MNILVLNAIAVVVALMVIYGVWIGVHLLARRRMGERKLGCQGPSYDVAGNAVCCRSGEVCEKRISSAPTD